MFVTEEVVHVLFSFNRYEIVYTKHIYTIKENVYKYTNNKRELHIHTYEEHTQEISL